MKFQLSLDKRAIADIQYAIDYYNEQSLGLGEKFEKYLDKYLVSLSRNPFFQVRYDEIHCLPLKKYPFMVHFSIKGQEVLIHAVLHTRLDPSKNWVK